MSRIPLVLLPFAVTTLLAGPVFRTQIPVSIGAGVGEHAGDVADFNGDGRADFLVTRVVGGSPQAQVYLSNGDATFTPSSPTTVASVDRTFHVGDVTGDGKQDIASAAAGSIVVYAGAGNGTFTQVNTLTASAIAFVTSGDATGDGTADLIATSINGITVWPGTGGGAFGSAVTSSATTGQVHVVDVNHDNRADIVIANPGVVDLYLATSGGAYATGVQVAAAAEDLLMTGAAVADIDGDGHRDIASHLGIAYGNGNGTFAAMTNMPLGGNNSTDIFAVDLDGDGDRDILSSDTRHLVVRRNSGNRTFAAPFAYVTPEGRPRLGEFDGDGMLDVLVTLPNNSRAFPTLFFVITGNGDGTFDAPSSLLVPGARSGWQGLGVADVTNDGKPDAIGVSAEAIHVFPRNGSSFGAPIVTSTGVDERVSYPLFGDLTNDGHADLVLERDFGPHEIWLSNGNGTFTKQAGTLPAASLIGDFTGDGKADVAAVTRDGVSIYPGNGAGAFGSPIATDVSAVFDVFLKGDVDGDNDLDLVFNSRLPNGDTAVLLNNGNGTFALGAGLTTHFVLGLVDMNADGKLDIVANDDPVSVHLGNGNGTFAAPRTVWANTAHVFADFNGDGRIDWGGGFRPLFGDGAGSFNHCETMFETSVMNVAFAAADIDANGSDDLLIFGWGFLDLLTTNTTTSRNLPVTLQLSATPTQATVTVSSTSRFGITGSTRIAVDGVTAGFADPNGWVPLSLTPGSHTITATFLGDGIYGTASATANVVAPMPAGSATVVTATATSASTVAVSWVPVTNATSYQLYRGAQLIATTASTSFDDSGLSANTTYRYRVVTGGVTSAEEIATTTLFTDPTITAGVTLVKLAHVEELRTAVNAVRAAASLAPFSFTNAPAANGLVLASHVSELRTAITQARTAIGLTTSFSDTGSTIRAVHITELRNAVK